MSNIPSPPSGVPSAEELARQLDETQRLARLGSWAWDIGTGQVTWSRETFRILGYDPERDTPSFELVLATAADPDRLAEFQTMTQRALAGEAPYDFLLPLRGRDGHLRYAHTLGEVVRDASGQPIRMFGTLHDITEAHERELALAESEQRFRALAESSPFGVFLLDADGDATYASPSLLELFDLDLDAFRAGAWRERILEEDSARVYADGREGRDERRTLRFGFRIAVRGETRHLRLTTRPRFGSDGSYLGQVGVVEDTTEEVAANWEREELEAQLRHRQQLDSLGVLAGGIAHDFNNLLVGVLGNAEFALDDLPEDHPARRAVEDIERAAERAADLTRQLLAYAGKFPVVVAPVSLSALVEEMVQLLRAATSRRAVFEVDCSQDLPHVRGDATQLRQIAMNLIRNASDALDGAAGVIRVRTRSATFGSVHAKGRVFGEPLVPGTAYVMLEVEDTGCGMPEEVVERIFDPFYSTKATGRGLGLATSLRIVRSHSGSIVVDSRPGTGTRISLLFPATDGVAEDSASAVSTESAIVGHGTLLVVDDEPAVRRTTEQILHRRGFTVLTAPDGSTALETFRREAGSLRGVLLDLTMPGLGGEEVLAAIRAEAPDLPVVLMSGFSEFEVGKVVEGAGPTTFLSKPFRGAALTEALQRVLDLSED